MTLRGFGVQDDVYPWQVGSSFSCSDEELNLIFKAGVRTVQIDSRAAFADCPTREQRAWVADSSVHQMVRLATNADRRLALHYLTLGNSLRSDGILPTAERNLRWYAPYHAANDLLRDVPEWNLIDWSTVHNEDTSAAIASSWARGLREYAEMAE